MADQGVVVDLFFLTDQILDGLFFLGNDLIIIIHYTFLMIMTQDQRQYPRYQPQGIQASITIEHPPHDPLCTNGDIIDISCTGIKIKLSTPLSEIIDGKIKIVFVLPDSGTVLTITGIIKHQQEPSECGFQYENNLSEDMFNDLMFECIKTT